jgi:hypothetical protein
MYYLHRGYQCAPENTLASLKDLLPLGSLTSLMMILKSAIKPQWIKIGHLESSFLEPVILSVLPSEMEDVFVQFPFSCSGFMIDHFAHGDDLYLFSNSVFGKRGTEECSTRDAADPASCYKDFHEEGMYDWIYDTAFLDLNSYQSLIHPDSKHDRVRAEHVDFWAVWMLWNTGGLVQEGVAIIPLFVCQSFMQAIALTSTTMKYPEDTNMHLALIEHLTMVDKYLWAHEDLLKKRLICFTAKVEIGEWLGFVAVNPWVQLLVYADRVGSKVAHDLTDVDMETDYLDRILHNTSDASIVNPDQTYSLLCFLNLASWYQDMCLKGEHLLFNYERMVLVGVPLQHLMHLGYGKVHLVILKKMKR